MTIRMLHTPIENILKRPISLRPAVLLAKCPPRQDAGKTLSVKSFDKTL